MDKIPFPQLAELESLRGNPVILYSSMINDDCVSVLYECLRRKKQMKSLDLILSTMGGLVTTTRQLALLLREYTQHLNILVPYHAKSAGTLLCLSANELVLGPLAALGPIDSHISSLRPIPSDAPSLISAEDIRAFREMATNWFGVDREEDRLQVLALLAQRIFPTSLSSFYRFDQLIRQIANELLAYQLPEAEVETRKRIVNQLIEGFAAHDYIISRNDAYELGLRVRFTTPQEEILLWDILQACRIQTSEQSNRIGLEGAGLIASTDFYAHQILFPKEAPPERHSEALPKVPARAENVRTVRWEITT